MSLNCYFSVYSKASYAERKKLYCFKNYNYFHVDEVELAFFLGKKDWGSVKQGHWLIVRSSITDMIEAVERVVDTLSMHPMIAKRYCKRSRTAKKLLKLLVDIRKKDANAEGMINYCDVSFSQMSEYEVSEYDFCDLQRFYFFMLIDLKRYQNKQISEAQLLKKYVYSDPVPNYSKKI